MDLRSAVEASARRHAIAAGFQGISQIPEAERPRIADQIARELDVQPQSVRFALGVHWNETRGVQGSRLTGSAPTSSTTLRSNLGSSALDVRLGQLSKPAAPKPVNVDSALALNEASHIPDLAPVELRTKVARRNVAFDEKVIQPGLFGAPDRKPRTGEYGQIRLKDLPDNHPLLEMRVFRGMGSADPAVHALRLTGKLIPSGTSGDYEAFKTYSHREPLDAYEFSLDPYVALKGTAGHGSLVSVTLKELREQGVKEVFRKVGDTEGGIFIAASFQPLAREVGHANGMYQLSAPESPLQKEGADKFARILGQKVPNEGGWDAFMASGAPATVPMKRAAVSEVGKQILFFHKRLEALKPNHPLLEKTRVALIDLKEKDIDQRVEGFQKLSRNLRATVADIEAQAAESRERFDLDFT